MAKKKKTPEKVDTSGVRPDVLEVMWVYKYGWGWWQDVVEKADRRAKGMSPEDGPKK